MGDYRRLVAWQVAEELVREVYAATRQMPSAEQFGLTSQMRRAAVSIVANIAEGAGRSGDRELRRFLRIARGSAEELLCEIRVAMQLAFLTSDVGAPLASKADRVGALLSGLIQSQSLHLDRTQQK
jgi:four helix bundle protein